MAGMIKKKYMGSLKKCRDGGLDNKKSGGSFANLPAEGVSWILDHWIKIGWSKTNWEGMADGGEQSGDGAMVEHGGAHGT